jgi:hypothetical protein
MKLILPRGMFATSSRLDPDSIQIRLRAGIPLAAVYKTREISSIPSEISLRRLLHPADILCHPRGGTYSAALTLNPPKRYLQFIITSNAR